MINFADMSGKIKIEMPKFTWWDWFLILGFMPELAACFV